MPSLCLIFRVHIPFRLELFSGGNVEGTGFNKAREDKEVVDKLADTCYLPANKILQQVLEDHPGRFKIAFSISGTAIELMRTHRPDVLQSFQRLAQTGAVEFLLETYYNSLSWLHSKDEFKRQVEMHRELIVKVFNYSPVVFRNTELIYNNDLARFMAGLGCTGILCEGEDTILKGRTPNQVYRAPDNDGLSILLRNTRLSDDIAFRFDDPSWNEQPLTAEKFAGWIHGHEEPSGNINLYFDYETFGIHKKPGTGIFEFLENLPAAVLAGQSWKWKTPSEVIEEGYPQGIFDCPHIISWQNKSVENCIWSENSRQRNSLHKAYQMENLVQKSNCLQAIDFWGRLQSADHFYFMSDQGNGGNTLYYDLNPFEFPESACQSYREVVTQFELYLIQEGLNNFRVQQRGYNEYNLYSGSYLSKNNFN